MVILVTDIVGSSRLWEDLGDDFRVALELHDQVMLNLIEATGGYALRSEGDGFRAVFGNVADAVRFGVVALVALRQSTWPASLVGGMAVRIGIHHGTAVVERETVSGRFDVRGREMTRAERVADAASGGQILLSETARRELDLGRLARLGMPDLRIKEFGRYVLTGLSEPMALATVISGSLGRSASQEPRATRAPAVPTNRTGRRPLLYGRERLLDELCAAMAPRSACLLLHGPLGVGKSALMDAWMAELQDTAEARAPAGGVWLADLVEAHDAQTAIDAVATALGLAPGPGALASVRAHLVNLGPAVLGMDNVERARDAVSTLIEDWRAQAPDLRLIVTSRVTFPDIDLRTMPVPPLEIPAPTPEAVAASAAVAMFLATAEIARPGFAIDSADIARDVAEVIRLVDGLPSGIELAASRLRLLSLDRLVKRLERGVVATLGDTGARGLAARIERSWEILAPWERLALAQLAVFRAPMTEALAAAVVSVPPDAPSGAVIVRSLRAQSLLCAVDSVDEPRLGLLAPMVGWARARGRQMSDDRALAPFMDIAIRRYTVAIASMGDRAWLLGLAGADGARRARSLALARADLRAAFRWAMKESEVETAAGAARALIELHAMYGPLDDVVVLRPVAELPGLPLGERAWLAWRIGWLLCLGGHPVMARELLEQSRALAHEARDLLTLAAANRSLTALRVDPGQAVRRVGDLLFLSGAGPGPRAHGIEKQTRAAIDNLRRALEAAGSSLARVVDVTVLLTHVERDFPGFNKVYAETFGPIGAPRTILAVSALATPGALELRVIASVAEPM